MEEQENNEEEQQKKQPSMGEQLLELGKQQLKEEAKREAKKVAKEAGKKVLELVKKLVLNILKLIAPYIGYILIAVVLICGIFIIKDKVADVIKNVSTAIVNFIKVGDKGPVAPSPKEMVELIDNALKEQGINKEDLGLGSKADVYLYKYMAASLSTQLPYIKDSTAKVLKEIAINVTIGPWYELLTEKQEVQGIVKIKRRTGDSTKDLTFKKYEDFEKMIDDNEEKSLNYFSIDENWMLCIAKYTNTKTWENDEEPESVNTFEMEKIPYQTLVSKYSVPFEFYISLLQITNNPEYVSAVADLVLEQGEIELTIFDETKVVETEYTCNYTLNKKWYEEEEKIIEEAEVVNNTVNEMSYGGGGNRRGNTVNDVDTIVEQKTETVKVEKKKTGENGEKIEEKEYTTQTINSIKPAITKANVWIINQTTEYIKDTLPPEYPLEESGVTNELKDEAEPGWPSKIGEENANTWKTSRSENRKQTVTKDGWKEQTTTTDIDSSKFLGLWRNSSGIYIEGSKYEPEGVLVKYKLPQGLFTYESPVENILSAEDWLYDLLNKSENTQTHARLMRYLIALYRAKGDATKVDVPLDLSIFEGTSYMEDSYTSGFDIHNENLFITDIEKLKSALSGGYSNSAKLVENAQALLDMQNQYKVNALFTASVSIIETTAGTKGNAIAYTNGTNPSNGKIWKAVGSYSGEKWNNWFNVKDKEGKHYGIISNGEGESHYKIYNTIKDSINGFGWNIAEGSNYYKVGNYTVGSIGAVYCPNTEAYPTQADDWIRNVTSQIARFYNVIGISIDDYTSGNGAGGLVGARGKGYRGIYTTESGKSYVEYLQYTGPWAEHIYADGTMHHKGCSVTSVAVILSGYGIDKNPEDIRPKNGTMINITRVLEQYGLKTERVDKPSETKVLQHLNTGNAVIIYAGGAKRNYSGQWSNGTGHYFPVLEAKDHNGYVSNVGSSTKTGWYDMSLILKDNIQVIFISK